MFKPPLKFIPVLAGVLALAAIALADPTAGWSPQKLDFKVQYPYDLQQSARYTFSNGIYHLWVFNSDKPFSSGTKTLPRTEMRFPDYKAPAQEQFEADMMVPSGTTNVCICQIHTSDAESPKFGATAFMLDVRDNGQLRHYDDRLVATNLYGHWFHLNVIHDTVQHTVQCYINNRYFTRYTTNKATEFYFKCGVYEQRGGSDEMQVYIRNVKLWTKQ